MGLRCCDCSYVKDLDKFQEDNTAYKISIANLCVITNGNIIVASEGGRKKKMCQKMCTCLRLHMWGALHVLTDQVLNLLREHNSQSFKLQNT